MKFRTPCANSQACSREIVLRLLPMPRKSFAATMLKLGISLAFGIWNLVLSSGFPDEPLPDKIQFNRDIRPIFSDTCFKCHGFDANKRKAELRMDVRADATAKHENGIPIVPG